GTARHQIKRKAIRQDGLFALVKKMPDATLRVLYSTYARFSNGCGFPNLPTSIRVLLTRNLSLSSSITIFLLTKFMVKVA
ncbi:hypothetical protein MZH50_00765, partial [Escherichia coli]|nr:hypothetical protein [Escherichia coli]MCK3480806.1 hypothetical protein [Escherichia coli]